MNKALATHHGLMTCEPYHGADARFALEVFSGWRGARGNKPSITLRIDTEVIRTTVAMTPANARDLAARLISAANAGDGKAPVALDWDHTPPPDTLTNQTNPHTGLYHEPEAL